MVTTFRGCFGAMLVAGLFWITGLGAFAQTTTMLAPDFAAGMTFARLPKDLNAEDNIVYKTVAGQDLKLTMFRPLEKKFDRAPLLVYIHGGGWGHGNRFVVLMTGGTDVVRTLTQAGVICVTIDYRLLGPSTHTVMDSEADCRDAIHFLVKNADRYGIDRTRVATFGGSAGGHLSLVTGLGEDKDYPCDPDLARYPFKVVAVAADFPQVSLVDPAMFKDSIFDHGQHPSELLGGPVEQKKDAAEKLSPTLLLKPDSPPIFLAHGDRDTTLNVANSIRLAELCRQKGVPVELVIVHNGGHGFNEADVSPTKEEVTRRTAAFLLKYLLPPQAR